ncbi:MAG: YchF/TatD family DNA exonuclease [Proteobacteria bacterium]|nr:YchF/TatD family DNA exonuclease [Pseudomonadota bacterium]
MLVDSHCHLDDERFKDDLPDVLKRAGEAGIDYMQTICTQKADFPVIHKMALEHSNIFCSYGIHPHHADTDMVSEEEIIAHGKLDKVIGIGETGLDYYYDNSDRKAQQESFRRHLRAARTLDLPVIIHTRDADADTIAILDEAKREGGNRLLLHCFSSTLELAEYAVANGIYLSASGIVTFKTADVLREAFKIVPPELLLVETDAPYLAPVPLRGKRCEPAFTATTAAFVADLKGMSLEDLAAVTTRNFFHLFSKAKQV